MTPYLLPCPFCGGKAATGGGVNYSFVNCTECMASTNVLLADGHQPTLEEAIAEWNTRAPQWQPIETAPKDGASFIVCHINREDSCMVVSFDDSKMRFDNLVWLAEEGSRYHRDLFSHWQPCPDLPQPRKPLAPPDPEE